MPCISGRRGLTFLGAVATAAWLAMGAGPIRAATPPAAAAGTVVRPYLTTGSLSSALAAQPHLNFGRAPRRGALLIRIDSRRRYQSIIGVGAALTDSSAWLIDRQLSSRTRDSLLSWLFGSHGLRLSFLRVPIGASDFTAGRRPYSYDDRPRGRSDPQLRHFSVAHDNAYVLPTLRQAQRLNRGLFTLANPWSPPGWMKTNDALDNMNHRGVLRPGELPVLANYLVRFVQAYARAGARVSALTPQNEPGTATSYPGMELRQSQEATLLNSYLAPRLRAAHLTTALFGYDASWGSPENPFAFGLSRDAAPGVLAGISWHCYYGNPTTMDTLHARYPALAQIVSECSSGLRPFSATELEIASLRNWASAVALWNLALDPSGGPVQPPNHGCPGCTGVITVDGSRHSYHPRLSAYQLGQVSAFLRPGSTRIASNNFVRYAYVLPGKNIASAGLDDVAFHNPDGTTVLVVYNNGARTISFSVQSGTRYFSYPLAPGSTVTFTWR